MSGPKGLNVVGLHLINVLHPPRTVGPTKLKLRGTSALPHERANGNERKQNKADFSVFIRYTSFLENCSNFLGKKNENYTNNF
jgi:hypothetical protein